MDKPRLVIVTPQYPPARGGVADHSRRLAQVLVEEFDVRVVTSAGIESVAPEGFRVEPVVRDWRSLAEVEAAIGRKRTGDEVLLWQYVPHMYGRGGVNLGIGTLIRKLAATGFRQVCLAHEIAAPASVWPHRWFYACAHRWQWRAILEAADRIGFSTEAWLVDWRRRAPGRSDKFFLVPSSSNLPDPVAIGRPRADAGELRLGVFGASADGDRRAWIFDGWSAARRQNRRAALRVIGDRDNAWLAGEEAREGLSKTGRLDPAGVAEELAQLDVLLMPFRDGVSERRTSFMAGLQCGCCIAATIGHNTGGSLRAVEFFASVGAGDRPGFGRMAAELICDPERRSRMGAAAREAFLRHYSWDVVAGIIGREIALAARG